MAKRVFFSFHYQDVIDLRANVVRNSWVTKKDREQAGFFDASIWEEAEKKGTLALKRLINGALNGTSATAVLVGSDTANRRWVRYEIFKSISEGKRLIAVHINGIKGKDTKTKAKGTNPFVVLGLRYSADGKTITPCVKTTTGWRASGDHAPWTRGKVAPETLRGKTFSLHDLGYKTYDWISDDGYKNLGTWVG